ncbi:MAG: DUF4388 domain-containing protein [Deltaproteobacteria bacterium]|nr:MAG: DUF4388 domain-containing protein [Deltaproteobacteria bacterium]
MPPGSGPGDGEGSPIRLHPRLFVLRRPWDFVSKQSLLLVDGDTRSLRVLEVSLRKAGFMVTSALSVQDALDKLALHAPDLIISETTFPDGDGFELRRRVRATPEWSEIPFIFLTAEAAIENKIRGLELGVDDYLTKPIYIKEIVTRINILLQKRQRVRFEERRDGRTRFAGRVQDMPVVDVIQTIEISRKSGVIQFVGERGRQAAIYFRDGKVIDAEAGSLQGEDAVYRLLTWSEGEFEVVFRTVRRREVITMSSQALLMEGMRRLDEWSRLFEQLPPLTHRFEVDTIELAARLADVPDDNNRILRLFDGKRTLLEVIDGSDVGDLECLQAISRLYFEELLLDLDHDKAPRRLTGQVPLVEVEAPTPVGDDISGPVVAELAMEASDAGAVAEVSDAAEEVPPLEAADVGGEPAAPVDPGPVGPLMGGYRPSSLRLIDEAVAAAQAIEPSLIDEGAAAREADHGHSSNGVSRTPPTPAANERGAPTEPGATSEPGSRLGFDPAAHLRTADREDSGLRMIGSLGRDRAEASGELATMGDARPLRSETARELVTILPRRITRELPIIAQELAESLPTPTPTSPVLAPRPVSAMESSSPQDEPTQRVALPGSGVRAPGWLRRLLRVVRSIQHSGPGLGALLLILLAVVLAGTAVLLRLRRHTPRVQAELIHEPVVSAGDPGTSPVTPGAARRGPTDQAAPPGFSVSGEPRGNAATEPPAQEPARTGPPVPQEPAGVAAPAAPGASGAPAVPAVPGNARGPSPGSGASLASDAPRSNSTREHTATGSDRHGSAEQHPRDGVAAVDSRRGTANAAEARSGGGDGTAASPPGRSGRGSGGAGNRNAGGNVESSPGTGSSAAASTGNTAAQNTTAQSTTAQNTAVGTGSTGKPGRAAGGADRAAEAKALCDQASTALDEGDFAHAFELAVSALRLRKTARGYMLRARAEQRLGRVSDALSSLDAATEIAPNAGAVWEQRGRILWAARRRDEARAAFERFLELDPKSPRAPEVLRLLNEPR